MDHVTAGQVYLDRWFSQVAGCGCSSRTLPGGTSKLENARGLLSIPRANISYPRVSLHFLLCLSTLFLPPPPSPSPCETCFVSRRSTRWTLRRLCDNDCAISERKRENSGVVQRHGLIARSRLQHDLDRKLIIPREAFEFHLPSPSPFLSHSSMFLFSLSLSCLSVRIGFGDAARLRSQNPRARHTRPDVT